MSCMLGLESSQNPNLGLRVQLKLKADFGILTVAGYQNASLKWRCQMIALIANKSLQSYLACDVFLIKVLISNFLVSIGVVSIF